MDFLSLFLPLFVKIYTLYMNFCLLFKGSIPKQLVSYNSKENKIFYHGYIGYTEVKMAGDFFTVEGQYEIHVNNKPLRVFLGGSLPGSNPDKSYFLTCNYVQAREPVIIKVIDRILDEHKEKSFVKGTILDYPAIVKELFED